MNYYNPYYYSMPTTLPTAKIGFFSRLLGNNKITLGGILNGTQRALNFANQAIPLVKQVRPMFGNAKTMFKVMNEFKRFDKASQNKSTNIIIDNKKEKEIKFENEYSYEEDGPTFFI